MIKVIQLENVKKRFEHIYYNNKHQFILSTNHIQFYHSNVLNMLHYYRQVNPEFLYENFIRHEFNISINTVKKMKRKNKFKKIRFKDMTFFDKVIFVKRNDLEAVLTIHFKFNIEGEGKREELQMCPSIEIIGRYKTHSFSMSLNSDKAIELIKTINEENEFEDKLITLIENDYQSNELSTIVYLDSFLRQMNYLKEELSENDKNAINEYIFTAYPFLSKKQDTSIFSVYLLAEVYLPLLEIIYPRGLASFNHVHPTHQDYIIETKSKDKMLLNYENKENQLKALIPYLTKKDIQTMKQLLNENDTICPALLRESSYGSSYSYDFYLLSLTNNIKFKELIFKDLIKQSDFSKSFNSYLISLRLNFNVTNVNLFKECMCTLFRSQKKIDTILVKYARIRTVELVAYQMSEIAFFYGKLMGHLDSEETTDDMKDKIREFLNDDHSKLSTLEDIHDELSMLNTIVSENRKNKEFKDNEFIMPTNEKYQIREAKDIYELKHIGKVMNHCVFSYSDEVINNEKSIVTIHPSTREKSPIVCMEIDLKEKSIKQIKGNHNKQIEDNDVLLLIDDFRRKNTLSYNTIDNFYKKNQQA